MECGIAAIAAGHWWKGNDKRNNHTNNRNSDFCNRDDITFAHQVTSYYIDDMETATPKKIT